MPISFVWSMRLAAMLAQRLKKHKNIVIAMIMAKIIVRTLSISAMSS